MGYRVSMTMETKHEVIADILEEYLKASHKEKTKILDRVQKTVKMHRKAIIRRLRTLQLRNKAYVVDGRGRPVYYTSDVIAGLKDIWDASNGLCGELLHPIIPEYIDIFTRDKMWNHTDEATGKLRAISETTVKRMVGSFEHTKRKGQGFSSTSPSAIKTIIPISVGEWKDVDPGVEQVDTVAHCGSSLKGDFVYTLNATDVPTLWNTLHAQWNKGQTATRESEEYVRMHLPFVWLRRHTDTGNEFITHEAKAWGDRHSIALTRSRPYKKNDNMVVEERNGHIVRKYVGYLRLDARETVLALNDLYVILNTYTNHFIASRKTLTTIRVGATYKKTYEKAKTPYQRVQNHPKVSGKIKEKLRLEHEQLNPAILLQKIEKLRTKLYDIQRKHGGPQI
jgi:hypothetical protein